MAGDAFTIRPMRADEIVLAADWAAAEGWNPGVNDAPCFATVDAEGFLIGELDRRPAATISCVNYDDSFAFLGFYIVRPDLRGRALGWRIWQAAIAHAGTRTIGLDGVVAQQDNYRKSGFKLAYRNVHMAAASRRLARRRGLSLRSPTSRSQSLRPMMPRCSWRRVLHSCARGSAPAATSDAR